MNTLGVLILALFSQETLFSHIAIFQARSQNVPWNFIHLLWVIITLIHLIVPYQIGRFFINRSNNTKVTEYINKFKRYIYSSSVKGNIIFFILGLFNYVYLNSFILATFKHKSKIPLIYIFLGDLVWYLLVVKSTTLGINILKNTQSLVLALLIVLLIGLEGKEILKRFR